MTNEKLADALEMSDWAGQPVGNKVLIQAAIDALRADGGKGEAVYQYKVRDLSGWHDCDAGAYERITTNMPEHVEARTLFTAPQAIGKGEAVAWMTDDGRVATDETKTMAMHGSTAKSFHIPLYAAPQAECAPRKYVETQPGSPNFDGAEAYEAHLNAECAPRGAQPVVEAMQAYLRQCRSGGMPKDVSDQIESAVNQENHLGYFAAPTPERADAEKDAALTNEKIEAAIEAWFDTDGKDVDDHQSRMRAAILAANKEPERAQESAGVQDAIEDVAKYFEDCGDPYGAKMIRKYAFNKFAANKAELTKEGE